MDATKEDTSTLFSPIEKGFIFIFIKKEGVAFNIKLISNCSSDQFVFAQVIWYVVLTSKIDQFWQTIDGFRKFEAGSSSTLFLFNFLSRNLDIFNGKFK